MNSWFIIYWNMDETVLDGPYKSQEDAAAKIADKIEYEDYGAGIINIPFVIIREP